jgi:D-aminopeptidase
MLHGAPAEFPFGEREARRVIADARSLQFAPGTRYSYANQNYRILGDVAAERLDESFGDLLRRRIFARAGMETAVLAADTRALPDGTEGYEGDVASGFRPARNNLIWTGDAGIAASLDDMIAWEKAADAGHDDAESVYGRLSAPVAFSDGAPAAYGYGLSRGSRLGRPITGHAGALRGWRSHRFYCPSERISVVVMFNHLADVGAAAGDLFRAALGDEGPASSDVAEIDDGLTGAWIEPETGILTRIARSSDPTLKLRFSQHPERLDAVGDGAASDGETRLSWSDDAPRLSRARDNLTSRLVPVSSSPPRLAGTAGRYRCAELDADLTVADAGGALYGAFSGFLGEGRMERLDPIGGGVWTLPCPRALDHTPPGDWTLVFDRDGAGAATSVRVGCWLARGLVYDRV